MTMAWCRVGNRPFSLVIVIHVTGAYRCHGKIKLRVFHQKLKAFDLLNIELLPRVRCANGMFTMRPVRSLCRVMFPMVDELTKSILCVLSGRRVYYATDMFTIWLYSEPNAITKWKICSLSNWQKFKASIGRVPDNKVHGANMGPTWVLSAPDGPHIGSRNLAIRGHTGDIFLRKSFFYASSEMKPLNLVYRWIKNGVWCNRHKRLRNVSQYLPLLSST